MKKSLFLVLVSAFLVSSCGKLVTDSYPDFVGTWVSTDFTNNYTLVIEENNDARYDRMNASGDTVETFLGTARIKSNNVMVIGNLKLKINDYPSFDASYGTSGAWVCKLEGWPFIRN